MTIHLCPHYQGNELATQPTNSNIEVQLSSVEKTNYLQPYKV